MTRLLTKKPYQKIIAQQLGLVLMASGTVIKTSFEVNISLGFKSLVTWVRGHGPFLIIFKFPRIGIASAVHRTVSGSILFSILYRFILRIDSIELGEVPRYGKPTSYRKNTIL